MSPLYTESPFLTLDLTLDNSPVTHRDQNSDADLLIPHTESSDDAKEDDEVPPSNSAAGSFQKLPVKVTNFSRKQLRISCREKLNILREGTFLCHDNAALEHLQHTLDECIEQLETAIRCEGGLLIRDEQGKCKPIPRPRNCSWSIKMEGNARRKRKQKILLECMCRNLHLQVTHLSHLRMTPRPPVQPTNQTNMYLQVTHGPLIQVTNQTQQRVIHIPPAQVVNRVQLLLLQANCGRQEDLICRR